ncbi:hypothetical protein P6U16_28035 (plasmid) [Rhizobium sp. 32-5/1]|uniref:hypothetical protein n=1 Tax=Rhizobium sp. 32-5/1 TaxID=3019602 RepID=UPI00240E1CAA|nr:hypothetical protein [Rhizobium sp. 32-5/1]WEZ86190.1 hypothetical protein P6U16_28035 [Rhizobium sp. 32-5/1]
MTRIGAANSNDHDFGVEIVKQGEEISLMFDLEKIDQFKAAFGDAAFLETATRYVQGKATSLGAEDQLWLWTEAVAAHVR